jgi:hypothetical protein
VLLVFVILLDVEVRVIVVELDTVVEVNVSDDNVVLLLSVVLLDVAVLLTGCDGGCIPGGPIIVGGRPPNGPPLQSPADMWMFTWCSMSSPAP